MNPKKSEHSKKYKVRHRSPRCYLTVRNSATGVTLSGTTLKSGDPEEILKLVGGVNSEKPRCCMVIRNPKTKERANGYTTISGDPTEILRLVGAVNPYEPRNK